jgi:AcrR family transcriptional regulator
MARETPPDRIAELVRCAAQVFIRQGYRRTQMADVASALGVAKGTLYLYVESKEALFDLVLRHADAAHVENPPLLPVRTPRAGETLRYVRERLQAERAPAALVSAVAGRARGTPREELEAIARELYATLARNRIGIKLLDSSARDLPDLAALWFAGARFGLLELLTQYLARRFRQRRLKPAPDATVAARLVIETLVFWAVHRHWDPAPQSVGEDLARETAVHFVVSALAFEEHRPRLRAKEDS